jgi:lipoate-protein ligase A
MARDLAMLDDPALAAGQISARVYRFEPRCLTLGRLQPLTDADLDRCSHDGIDVVRRPTGGRAVLHADEVTYAVAAPVTHPQVGGSVAESCRRIHSLLLQGLGVLGVEAELAPARGGAAERSRAAIADCVALPAQHEVVIDGRKLIGSAQLRRDNLLLQHGSILLSVPPVERYLRAGPGGSARMGLREIVPDVTWEMVAACVIQTLEAAAGTAQQPSPSASGV